LVALLPVIGVGIGTYLVSYQNGRQQSIDRLESVAARKELAIQVWQQSLQQELEVASRSEYTPKLVTNAIRLSNEGSVYAWYNDMVRKWLQAFVGHSSQFTELFLVDSSGKVIVSTNQARENIIYTKFIFDLGDLSAPYTQLPFIRNSKTDSLSDSDSDSSSVFMLIPVNDTNNRLLGAIGGKAPINGLTDILKERTGLGSTGKAYLINSNYALLVETNNNLSGNEVVNSNQSPGIDYVIKNSNNLAGIFHNAQGINVVGIYRWLPNLKVALTVEQDASEAFRAVSAATVMNLIVAFVALILAIIAALYMTRNIADPIVNLARTATQIAQGDLKMTAGIVREDEVGALARAFNSMTGQLRDLIGSLEQRVGERTKALQIANEALERKALQMETSAQVGREITSILDLDTLLNRVVELIQGAFGYYHVQVFLLDRETSQLVLRASSKRRPVQFTHLDFGKTSINGMVAESGEIALVNDVSQSPDFLVDNELPDTRSELVIPLRQAEQVTGTLDVQSSMVNAFSKEDILVIQGLADQITIAIENAHLYDQSRELAVLAERQRLSRELHDSVTQSLYSLVLFSEGWRRMLNTKVGPQIEEYFNRIGEIAQQSLREMRLLIYELRPPALEKEGLVGALQKRLDSVEKQVGIEARVVMEEFIDLPITLEEDLYWIAQEALNNALKHAQASYETVRICSENSHVILEITDNGVGFDPQMVQHRGGMGLTSMIERAKNINGELTIHSETNVGTIVRASVPFIMNT
jgi:signal transduction histidine kinase